MKISVDLINRYLKKPLKTQQMAEILLLVQSLLYLEYRHPNDGNI